MIKKSKINGTIDATAIIRPGAVVEEETQIGPYCLIEEGVHLGKGNKLHAHVVITGDTVIGDYNEFFPFSSIGQPPQDLKFHGEDSRVIIGNYNVFREGTTVHKGTESGGMLTKIADHCLFMANSHVAHDCQVGNHVIVANNVPLGGHVTVEDFAIIGGNSAVHQFTRIGQHSLISGVVGVDRDVPPYTIITVGQENRMRSMGINLIGLKRRNFSDDAIRELLKFYHNILERTDLLLAEKISLGHQQFEHNVLIVNLLNFLQERKKRPICLPVLED